MTALLLLPRSTADLVRGRSVVAAVVAHLAGSRRQVWALPVAVLLLLLAAGLVVLWTRQL